MYAYYDLYRNCKDPVTYRRELVKFALSYGIKPAARKFNTTVKTVRKWVRRFEEGKKPALKDQSTRPHESPKKIRLFWQFKIQEVCTQAQKNKKRINAVWIKRIHKVPYSAKTILKVMREVGYLPQTRKKYQRKRDLRELKRTLKPFEKIQVDIKYLDDIPEFYGAFIFHRLPKYQITARCVRTGALFFAYTMEKSSTNTTMFMLLLGEHLRRHGVDLATVTIQTDNGTEFVMPWNSLDNSPFQKAVTLILGARHRSIPPGAKTWQSDVESSQRLIEEEFYACEYFYARADFLKKAAAYQHWFNQERFNSYKQGTPKLLLQECTDSIKPEVLIFRPLVIDTLYRNYKDVFKSLAA